MSRLASFLSAAVLALSSVASAQVVTNPGPGSSPTYTATGSSSGSSVTGLFSAGTLSYSDTGNLAALQASINGVAQVQVQNTNAGSTASADIIVANDQGTASTHYGDFGTNSSAFTGSGSLNLAGATYLYSATGDLVLGTSTLNGIHFVVNNGATDAGGFSSAGAFTLGTPLAVGSGGSGVANTGNLTWNASQTFSFTSGQTMTFPTTSATLARTDAAQSFTGLQTIAALTVGYITMNTNSVAIGKSAAPTACAVSGVTVCTVTKNAGTFGFKYTLTTGTPSGNTVTLALTAASDGYICDGVDISTGLRLQETTDSTTAPVLTAYNLAGAATNFSAGDALLIKCISY